MKNINKLLALALVIMSVFAISIPALAATTKYGDCTPGQYINVRNSAGGSTVVYKLRNGEKVTVESTSGGWSKISSPKSGYVDVNFLTSTPDWMASYGATNVRYGTSQQMKNFQNDLNSAIGAGLKVDGFWGPATEQAVKNLQKKAGITQDGIPGPVTMMWTYEYAHD